MLKDFPLFTTENGIASLKLSQIPYTGVAYITLRDSQLPDALLADCTSFCRAVGAERVYACGCDLSGKYQIHTHIWQMEVHRDRVGQTDAVLTPVSRENLSEFRSLYNEKMTDVPNASRMTQMQGRDMLGKSYFVSRDGQMLGIVIGSGNMIEAIASCVPGSGETLVRGICSVLTGDVFTLTVASTNTRAVNLYRRMGFTVSNTIATWYKII